MKNAFAASMLLLLAAASLLGCAPVINKDLMGMGVRNVPLLDVRLNPDLYREKVFVFGGVISGTTVTPEESLIEAVYVSVDSQGYLTGDEGGKYLAVFPKGSRALDPVSFRKGRKFTIAAEFVGMHKGQMGDGFPYPLFEIKQIHLWEEGSYYYPQAPYWRYSPYWWY